MCKEFTYTSHVFRSIPLFGKTSNILLSCSLCFIPPLNFLPVSPFYLSSFSAEKPFFKKKNNNNHAATFEGLEIKGFFCLCFWCQLISYQSVWFAIFFLLFAEAESGTPSSLPFLPTSSLSPLLLTSGLIPCQEFRKIILLSIFLSIYLHIYVYTYECVDVCIHICIYISLYRYIYIWVPPPTPPFQRGENAIAKIGLFVLVTCALTSLQEISISIYITIQRQNLDTSISLLS